MKRTLYWAVAGSLPLLLAACTYEPSEALLSSWHERDVREWREGRLSNLTGPEEYLRLIGLYWLEQGSATIGSDPQSDISLPLDGGRLGVITVHYMRESDGDPEVVFTPAEGADVWLGTEPVVGPVPLRTDVMGEPTVLRSDDVSFYLIERNERLGVRVLDEDAPTLVNFHGIEHFPISEKWLVEGEFEPFDSMRTIEVADVSGGTQLLPSPGRFHFEMNGEQLSLDLIDSSDDYWIIFGDETSGKSTYGAGRYLYSRGLEDESGKLVVDFNLAYNPPCAFNEYATCPLPPRQNILPVPVTAGELDYGAH